MFKAIKKGNELISNFYIDELTAILKDRGALLILLFALFIYPIIYGIAYKNEILRDIPVAVIDLDKTTTSRQLMRMIDATEQMDVTYHVSSLDEAETLFQKGQINGIIAIPQKFEEKMFKGQQGVISVYCDAGYLLIYKQTLSGTLKATSTFAAGVEIKRYMAKGAGWEQAHQLRDPIPLHSHLLYNPAGGYNSFILPGLLIIILQQTLLIGTGLLGGTRTEQKRRRFAVPTNLKKGGVIPVVIGKSGAYLTLYLVNTILTQIWVFHWFNLPVKGTLLPAIAIMLPFLMAVTFLGIGLSTLFKRREHSILFMVFLSPIILFLSGLSWPAEAIPHWLYLAGHLFPSTVAVPGMIRVQLLGAQIEQVAHEVGFLIIQAAVYFIMALALFYKAAKKSQ
jgi:ABC-2 type transport system permease protein